MNQAMQEKIDTPKSLMMKGMTSSKLATRAILKKKAAKKLLKRSIP